MDGCGYREMVAKTLHAYQLRNILCDTVIETSDKQLSAHSLVLAAASEHLRQAFGTDVDISSVFKLELCEFSSNDVLAALHYIYTGHIEACCDLEECAGFHGCASELGNIFTALGITLQELHDEPDISPTKLKYETVDIKADPHTANNSGLISSATENVNINLSNSVGENDCNQTLVNGHDSVPDSFLYVCAECHKSFSSASDLCDHLSLHDNNLLLAGNFICDTCGKRFRTNGMLRRHIATHGSSRPYACSQCGKAFLYRSYLASHMFVHTGEMVKESARTCTVCGRQFRTASGMRKHRQEHSNKTRFSCSVCAKTFPFASVLREHERVHFSDCSYICDVCGRAFKHSSNMLKHRRISHEMVTVQQQQPLLLQPNESSITYFHAASGVTRKTIAAGSSTDRKTFQCNFCSKIFSSASYRDTHLRVHTDERPFTCEVCQYSFKQRSNLKKHLRTHNALDRPFFCIYCNKSFQLNSNLLDHIKIHTNDRRFGCEICNKRFITAAALRSHILRHDAQSTVDKIACSEPGCSRSFASEADLGHHIEQQHGSALQFLCKICDKRFTSSSGLRRHLLVHSGVRLHVCELCGKAFKHASNLHAHRRTRRCSQLRGQNGGSIGSSCDEVFMDPDGQPTKFSGPCLETCEEAISEPSSFELSMVDYQLVGVMDFGH